MTDAPAAIQGTFAEVKFIKTRKVCQIVIELPIEQADAALSALGGVPRPDAERWVAVAQLDPTAVVKPSEPAKERRAFCDLPMSQQAALKSEDPVFVKWLRHEFGECFDGDAGAAQIIRGLCQVSSRSEILPGTRAGDRWIELLREYEGGR
jgi:hypothetical protein